jgi:CRISPR-associated protein Cas1
MIKRTVAIERPARLSVALGQLVIEQEGVVAGKVPIEDIGVLVIENPAVQYTHRCITALLENNSAVVICGGDHHPAGLLLPLDTNSVQSERFRGQVKATVALKKRLWRQTVRQKIVNQAGLLKDTKASYLKLTELARRVKSGDAANVEGRASRIYWRGLFGSAFRRDRFGVCPNNLLNYGYTILRAATARALVSSGLLPTLGIHHKNRYNAFCLADDIMEPYRVFVDKKVYALFREGDGENPNLDKERKKELLTVLACDVAFDGSATAANCVTGPLMTGLHRTTASLVRCFEGVQKEIEYPSL